MTLTIDFLLGFLLNLFVALIIVRFIYYPKTQDKHFVFTFMAFNTVIYFVLSLLVKSEIGVGVGFGLFAIFHFLRYRTDPIPIREMTYLFIIMALPVMNSSCMLQTNWALLLLANSLVILTLWLLEKGWGFHYQTSQKIIYENIELIVPSRRAELIADLEQRIGQKISSVTVGNIDFLHDTATLQVSYPEQSAQSWAKDNPGMDKSKDDDDE
jgi:hypothetical protein